MSTQCVKTIVSIVVNGVKSIITQKFILDFFNLHNVDIALLQEANSEMMHCLSKYRTLYNLGPSFRGSAILYRQNLEITDFVVNPEGRVISAVVDNSFKFANIYAPSGSQAKQQSEIVYREHLAVHLTGSLPLIFLGDFNCVENGHTWVL